MAEEEFTRNHCGRGAMHGPTEFHSTLMEPSAATAPTEHRGDRGSSSGSNRAGQYVRACGRAAREQDKCGIVDYREGGRCGRAGED